MVKFDRAMVELFNRAMVESDRTMVEYGRV